MERLFGPKWVVTLARGSRLTLLVLTVLAGCEKSETIQVAAPVASGLDDDAPSVALPPTSVVAPIVLDLRPLLAELEQTIPREFGSLDKKQGFQVKKTPSVIVAAKLRRAPLVLEFKDNSVIVTATFAYQGKAWVKTLFTTNVECGTGSVQPRMRLRVQVTYDLTSDWHLATKTRLLDAAPLSTQPRDRCQIGVISYDATDKIVDAAKDGIAKALVGVDRKLAHTSLAKPIGGIWATLQKPIGISQGRLWLQINPTAISVGGVTVVDSMLTIRLGLTASPQMLAGSRPPDAALPLPPLGHEIAGGDTAIVLLEGIMLYAAANQALDRRVRGKSFKAVGGKVKIEKVVAAPAGGGRLSLGVQLSGRVRGTIYAVGTPKYDPQTDLISVPDLAFDANTMNALGGALAWLVQGPFLTMVRDNAQLTAADLMKLVLELANKNLNRELTTGVFLRGSLATAQPIHIRATGDGLTVRARAAGRLWLEISKTDFLPAR